MNELRQYLLRIEFEGRIFISFGIVIVIFLLSLLGFPSVPRTVVIIGGLFRVAPHNSTVVGYSLASAIMALSLLSRATPGLTLTRPR